MKKLVQVIFTYLKRILLYSRVLFERKLSDLVSWYRLPRIENGFIGTDVTFNTKFDFIDVFVEK